MMSAYDFLDEPLASESSAAVNVFGISGPGGESLACNVLGFLLDPNERHGFGTTFVDALLTLLDGQQTAAGERFDAASASGSSEWSVATETCTDGGARIDVLLEHDELDVTIIIQSTCTPARTEGTSAETTCASRARSIVVHAIFASQTNDDAPSSIRVLRYDDLFDAADAALYEIGPMVDQRSLELYAQFREAMSERISAATITQEQQCLDEMWSAIEHRQDQVLDFFSTIDTVNAVLVARSARLQRSISTRLHVAGIEHTTWVANAGDHAWGRSRGERALTYIGFSTATRGSIELLVGWLPRTGTFGYAVKAHATHNRPPRTWDHIPLGLPLHAPEHAVADRFVTLVVRWMADERPE